MSAILDERRRARLHDHVAKELSAVSHLSVEERQAIQVQAEAWCARWGRDVDVEDADRDIGTWRVWPERGPERGLTGLGLFATWLFGDYARGWIAALDVVEDVHRKFADRTRPCPNFREPERDFEADNADTYLQTGVKYKLKGDGRRAQKWPHEEFDSEKHGGATMNLLEHAFTSLPLRFAQLWVLVDRRARAGVIWGVMQWMAGISNTSFDPRGPNRNEVGRVRRRLALRFEASRGLNLHLRRWAAFQRPEVLEGRLDIFPSDRALASVEGAVELIRPALEMAIKELMASAEERAFLCNVLVHRRNVEEELRKLPNGEDRWEALLELAWLAGRAAAERLDQRREDSGANGAGGAQRAASAPSHPAEHHTRIRSFRPMLRGGGLDFEQITALRELLACETCAEDWHALAEWEVYRDAVAAAASAWPKPMHVSWSWRVIIPTLATAAALALVFVRPWGSDATDMPRIGYRGTTEVAPSMELVRKVGEKSFQAGPSLSVGDQIQVSGEADVGAHLRAWVVADRAEPQLIGEGIVPAAGKVELGGPWPIRERGRYIFIVGVGSVEPFRDVGGAWACMPAMCAIHILEAP